MSLLSLKKTQGDDLVPILQTLPSCEDLDQFHQAFKSAVHPIVPICHLPSLERTLSTFWNNKVAGTSGDSLALILAVTYCGLVCINDKRYEDLATSIYNSYERLLVLLSFPSDVSKATIALLQSYLLMNTCRASQIEPLSSFGFLAPSVRIAQALKLNIERNSLLPIDREIQRRIWWHLIYMDVEAALASGLPTLIHEDDYTTLIPSELDETAIDENEFSSLPIAASYRKSSMMHALHGRWQWAVHIRTWRRKMRVTDLDFDKLEYIINDLSSEIPIGTNNEWPRSYLRLHSDRAICSAARFYLDGVSVGRIDCENRILR